jgi:hypothetical protein
MELGVSWCRNILCNQSVSTNMGSKGKRSPAVNKGTRRLRLPPDRLKPRQIGGAGLTSSGRRLYIALWGSKRSKNTSLPLCIRPLLMDLCSQTWAPRSFSTQSLQLNSFVSPYHIPFSSFIFFFCFCPFFHRNTIDPLALRR